MLEKLEKLVEKTPKKLPELIKPHFGRPRRYRNALQLQNAIQKYLEKLNGNKPTITGLCLSLGFSSRSGLAEMEKNPLFSDVVKKARLFVEQSYETLLIGQNPAGPIFALKNMGWSDRREITGADGGPIEARLTHFPPEPKTIAEWERQIRDASPVIQLPDTTAAQVPAAPAAELTTENEAKPQDIDGVNE